MTLIHVLFLPPKKEKRWHMTWLQKQAWNMNTDRKKKTVLAVVVIVTHFHKLFTACFTKKQTRFLSSRHKQTHPLTKALTREKMSFANTFLLPRTTTGWKKKSFFFHLRRRRRGSKSSSGSFSIYQHLSLYTIYRESLPLPPPPSLFLILSFCTTRERKKADGMDLQQRWNK